MEVPLLPLSVANKMEAVKPVADTHVLDAKTHKTDEMSFEKFAEYYNKPADQREELLNVISLEISNSDLDRRVRRPEIVNSLDWIDLAWPKHLPKCTKVQKYCLMYAGGCYTDFHIDLGGTSMWYHILKGKQFIWIIKPLIRNLNFFVKWSKSESMQRNFFPDYSTIIPTPFTNHKYWVEKCQLVELEAGNTFMLPSGWIYAVYTPSDSLVFGGNFLHSFEIPMQLDIYRIEDKIGIEEEYRFPHFNRLLWFVLDRYLFNLTGKSFMTTEYKEENRVNEETFENVENVHLTIYTR